MPDEILIFGSIGTQVVINRKMIFELVAIGVEGAATWRTRCVVCRSPVFTEVMSGRLPARARCNAHIQAARHPEEPIVEYQHEAEIQEISVARPPAMIQVSDFNPQVTEIFGDGQLGTTIAHGKQVVGRIKSAIEPTPYASVAPISGFVRMHMGDEDDTSVEAPIGEHAGGPLVIDRDVTLPLAWAGPPPPLPEGTETQESPYTTDAMLAELEEMAPDDGPPPPLPEEDIWMPRLEKFFMERNRIWLPSWGPRPDQPGCEAPSEFLDRFRRR